MTDWTDIQALVASGGTGPGSVLYKTFSTLKTVTGADAVDYDNEDDYDTGSAVALSLMLADLGYKISLCPYQASSHWSAVYSQVQASRPGAIDWVYLQDYAGGAGNDPAQWDTLFGSMKVMPGLWAKNGTGCTAGMTPAQIQTQMTTWKPLIAGGFIWLYDDVQACSAPGLTTADYAAAINTALQ